MASVIGHSLGAATVYQLGSSVFPEQWRGKRGLILAAGIGAIPDLDVVIYALTRWTFGNAPHRGLSHSVLFSFVLALLAWAVIMWTSKRDTNKNKAPETDLAETSKPKAAQIFLVLFAVALIHLFLDWGMECGPPIRLWAPFSNVGYNSPVQFIPTAFYARSVGGLVGVLFRPATWLGVFLEFAIMGPIFSAALMSPAQKQERGGRWKVWIASCLLSFAGVMITFRMYN